MCQATGQGRQPPSPALVDSIDTPPEVFGGRHVGSVRLEFAGNRITAVSSQHHDAFVRAVWASHTGDRDRLGELNVGVNPKPRGCPTSPRFPTTATAPASSVVSVGHNSESGGPYRSSYHQRFFLTDATVTANGKVVVDEGRLVLPCRDGHRANRGAAGPGCVRPSIRKRAVGIRAGADARVPPRSASDPDLHLP